MGIINIEGLGEIEIQGDTPTPEESRLILKAAEARKQEKIAQDLPSTQETFVTERELSSGLTKEEISAQDKALSDFVLSPEFGRLVLEVGGAIGGAALTGGLSAPASIARIAMISKPFLKQLLKSSAGAGVGSGTGGGVAQIIDPKDDMVKEIIRASIEGAAGEAIGLPIAKGVEKVLAPVVKTFKGADDAARVIEEQREIINKGLATAKTPADKEALLAAAKNGVLTPGLITDNQFIDILQNISEVSLLGSGGIRTAKEGAETIAKSGIDDFVEQFIKTQDRVATGQLFQTAITKNQDAWNSLVKSKYKNVDKLLGSTKQIDPVTGIEKIVDPTVINTIPYKTAIKQQISKLERVAKGKSDPEAISLLKEQLTLPDNASFSLVNDYRSKLLERGRYFSPDAKNLKSFKDTYMTLQPRITDLLENAPLGSGVSTEAKLAWRQANQFYKEGIQDYSDEVIIKLLEKDPELVFKELIKAGDRPTVVKETFDIINRRFNKPGEKAVAENLKTSLKGEFLRKVINDSTDSVGQYSVLSSKKINDLIGSGGKFEDTAKTLFTGQEYSRINQLKDALEFAQGRLKQTGSPPGAVFFQLKQAGAAGTILALGGAQAFQGDYGTAAGIVLSPVALGYALSSPKVINYMIKGAKAKNPTAAGTAFRQTISQLISEGTIDRKEGERVIQESYNTEKEAKPQKQEPRSQVPTAQPVAQAAPSPESPPTNIFAANTPGTPMTTGVTPTAQPAQPMDKAQQYAGLFPFDIAGQQIARRG